MSTRAYNFAIGVLGGVASIAVAATSYFAPSDTAALVNAAIGIGTTAVVEILGLFRKKDE